MAYFIVFSKTGLVLHESGHQPIYISDLILQINPSLISGKRHIRDFIMEYQIRGQIVYLSIHNKEILSKYIEEYEASITDGKANTVANKKSNNKIDKKNNESKYELNFSDNVTHSIEAKQSVISNTSMAISKSISKTFSIFTKKIELNKLELIMNEFLIKKNIDPQYCKLITDDVIVQLTSKQSQACTEQNKNIMVTESEFKEKIANTLQKILPGINHEKFIESIRNRKPGGAYSICFVGVNGVGKSTSLAKMACYLLKQNLRVFIAACDTFRAGAIEQLKVHVDRFVSSGHSVGFYESGYKKDDANVAKSAIIKAEDYDVILIDTAGRMHNKKALMASLSKLIRVNNPDHIIFVGEALVGGDSLSHIKEFNKSIDEGIAGRKIDSIILTKVDTVSEKIGQLVNLTFSSSSPILFLGTGQNNSDLKRMDPKEIAELIVQ